MGTAQGSMTAGGVRETALLLDLHEVARTARKEEVT